MADKKIAFIGARGHHSVALRELERMEGFEVNAVSPGGDDDKPLIAWCEQHGQSPRRFENYVDLLDQSPPDVAVVCGPFARHAEMSIAAIERGIHVLCEKPVALTFADLDRLRNVCRDRAQVLFAGMMFSRYDPGFFTAWKLIRSGAIGELRLINARKSYKLGNRPDYYHRRENYGGTIPWVGSHAIDWIQWIADKPFMSVYATHSVVANGGNGSMERSAMCQFSLAGGLAASVSIDVFRPENAPTHGDDWARFVGTEGVLEARPESVYLINRDNDGSKSVLAASDRFLMQDIVEHIAGGRNCLIDTASTLALTDACLRARQSADENRVVEF